jgi:hypothetical protein
MISIKQIQTDEHLIATSFKKAANILSNVLHASAQITTAFIGRSEQRTKVI